MGEQNVRDHKPQEQELRAFTKALLEDVQAFERMLDEGLIESGVRRIGAEQEMFLVDRAMRPAMKAMDVLERLNHPQFTTELALFNAEVNLKPQLFEGDCLWRMEQDLEGLLAQATRAARAEGIDVLLAGILPTVKQKHLRIENITPKERYRQLNATMVAHRGGKFQILVKGIDELQAHHDNVLFEACNTSFQIHFQVGPDEFVPLYNLAQVVTAPVLAPAVNSAVFLQHRLWKETRVALFQQAIDTRQSVHQERKFRPRVAFGHKWIDNSVLEIFREDIARFRVLISTGLDESPLSILDRGEIPTLRALRLHNGTIYRWNRPCYGVSDGKAHLRIEHRSLPAGPTVVDEVANAAFFFGLMTALADEHDDIRKVMRFDQVQDNFMAAARYGLEANFHWIGGKSYSARDLLLNHLIPCAEAGLKSKNVRSSDIDRYLGVLRDRVRMGRTGARWMLESLAGMDPKRSTDERYRALTAAINDRQNQGTPVHEWSLATLEDSTDWRDSYRYIEQVMTRDLFTVGPEDLVDLAANLMDWEHIRHVPVEDGNGKLVGIVSHRRLLRLVARGLKDQEPVPVKDIMKTDPITVSPDTHSLEAIDIMRQHGVSCLPVVKDDNKLVGIVSEVDFIEVAAKLLEDKLRDHDR
jgi:CBS domain-containing protein/gamma-glutamyl:cysteine ligase YbdK (ATP-grasp superfamily)